MAKARYDVPCKKTFMFDPHELVVIGVDTKHGLADHAMFRTRSVLISKKKRPLWDEDLAHNIAMVGVVTTIVVRREVLGGKKVPVVVAGVRRVLHGRRAMELRKSAGDDTPLRIEGREGTPDDLGARAIAFSENMFRIDDEPVARARMIQACIDEGEELGAVALAFGIKPRRATALLQLLNLAGKVQKIVGSGPDKISMAAAKHLTRLSRDEQMEAAKTVVERGGTEDAAKRVVASKRGDPSPAPKRRSSSALTGLRFRIDDQGPAFKAGVMYAMGHDIEDMAQYLVDHIVEEVT